MITKVESFLPQALSESSVKQSETEKKKVKPAKLPPAEPAEETEEESNIGSVRMRHLGTRFDVIA